MKKICFLFLVFSFSVNSFSQVGINTISPDPSAALEILSSNKGLLIPRMTTTQKQDIVNPATSLLVYDTDLRQLQQNAGTSTDPQWVPLVVRDAKNSFFYMPSVSIDASEESVSDQTLDLYAQYKNQFMGVDGTTFKASSGAPLQIPYFPVATDLYYYITYYDPNVIEIKGLSADGVLTYVIKEESDYDSFMNVVFVVKQ